MNNEHKKGMAVLFSPLFTSTSLFTVYTPMDPCPALTSESAGGLQSLSVVSSSSPFSSRSITFWTTASCLSALAICLGDFMKALAMFIGMCYGRDIGER